MESAPLRRRCGHLASDLFGMRPVVGVVHGEKVARRLRQRQVARGVAAAVGLLSDEAHAPVGPGGIGGDVGGGVVARVVDDQDLQIAVGLVDEPAQRRGQRRLGLVGRHQHGDAAARAAGRRAGAGSAQVVERQWLVRRGLAQGLQAETGEKPVDLGERRRLGRWCPGFAGGGGPARRANERGGGIAPARQQRPRRRAAAGPGEIERLERADPARPGRGRMGALRAADPVERRGEVAVRGLPARQGPGGGGGLRSGRVGQRREIASRRRREAAPEPVLEPVDAARAPPRPDPGAGAGLEGRGQGGAQRRGQCVVEPANPGWVHVPQKRDWVLIL